MDLTTELTLSARLLVAAVLGSIIGIEREMRDQDAGVGTFAIVCLGACAFAIMSFHLGDAPNTDSTRIAASVAGGIGFLGAGIILHRKNQIRGLTTAAALWTVSGVGLAVGFGLYVIAAVATVLCVAILTIRHLPPLERYLSDNDKRRHHKASGTQSAEE
jgi:putative Mg2+ transporter-C (MgtC) family protein